MNDPDWQMNTDPLSYDEHSHDRLHAVEAERLQAEMEEGAWVMYDEILQIEAEFHPLEEEIHRQIEPEDY